jgi:hypothetical protein
MACRKAAYRAMTELSEWMEEQQAQAEEILAATKEEQRKVWTPTDLWEQCCTPWLAHGPEISMCATSSRTGFSNNSKGCSGGCGKDHPRVTLEFALVSHDDGKQHQQAVATLSHALDPFVNYFVSLCKEGLASPCAYDDDDDDDKTRYYLTGYLHIHLEKMHKEAPFPSHLIKVSRNAVDASKRVQERYMEYQEESKRQAKKRKMQLQDPFSNMPLLDSVLDICYNNQTLQHHLDLADIGWMRTSCKVMAKYAARLASLRMKQIRLSYSVLGNPTIDANRDSLTNMIYVDTNEREGRPHVLFIGYNHWRYTVLSSRLPLISSLLLDDHDDNNSKVATALRAPEVFVPQEYKEFDINAHRSFLVRVYLDHNVAAGDTFPEKNVSFSVAPPLEVLRSCIDAPWLLPSEPRVPTPRYTTYKISTIVDHGASSLTQNDQQATTAADRNSNAPTTDQTTGSEQQHWQRGGKFHVKSIKFDFNDLHSMYVRKKLTLAKLKLEEIKKKRSATFAEKNYVKALAKAAREAPEHVRAIEFFRGW